MLNVLNYRKVKAEEERLRMEQEAQERAHEILSRPEDILKHLEKKFPDVAIRRQVDNWYVGQAAGQQDVLDELRRLIKLTNE